MRQLGVGALAAAAWQRRWQYGSDSVRRWRQLRVAAACGDGGGGGGSDGSLAVAAEAQQRGGGGGSGACAGKFCRQGELNNQQGREVATEGSGVGTDGRTMMVIWDGRREAVGVGRRNNRGAHVQQRDQGERRR
jgi:hypothetical protein